jgi:hypothetical protein
LLDNTARLYYVLSCNHIWIFLQNGLGQLLLFPFHHKSFLNLFIHCFNLNI